MSKIKLPELVKTINECPTGGYVGITDYVSENGDVTSVTGHIGCSYADGRRVSIQELKDAIALKDFSEMTVQGQCYWDESAKAWNSRKRSLPLENYDITYDFDKVLEMAKGVLHDWENPAERNSNKVNLAVEKESGLVYNTETGTINLTLLVDHVYYKEEKSEEAKKGMGEKVKAQEPLANLKEQIRSRFAKKIRSYTISEGKFASLSIGGRKFASDEITF